MIAIGNSGNNGAPDYGYIGPVAVSPSCLTAAETVLVATGHAAPGRRTLGGRSPLDGGSSCCPLATGVPAAERGRLGRRDRVLNLEP